MNTNHLKESLSKDISHVSCIKTSLMLDLNKKKQKHTDMQWQENPDANL